MNNPIKLESPAGLLPQMGNPILPGYFADPSLVQFNGKFYLYATIDPWGGDTLGCWESTDFANWTYRVLNWPTFDQCKSPTSRTAKVWAPSVVRARNGKFYMFVSVRNEVWVGTADHPLGPWRNILGDKPFIHGEFRPGFHMIDAEAFIDDDGSAYLYWGSGWDWVNGKCFAAKLGKDMASFDSEIGDVTPTNYFEAPFMVKRHGLYFLMYSNGRTDRDTYCVHYAVSKHPLGPFTEGPNSPVLATNYEKNVLSPGHHAIFQLDGKDYILYHRHSIPFDPKFIGRQTCVDEIRFSPDGSISSVPPTHEGPATLRTSEKRRRGLPARATASSSAGELFGPERVLDGNYATRWSPAADSTNHWLQLDLGSTKAIHRQEIRLEYAWKTYRFRVEIAAYASDSNNWKSLADFTTTGTTGSPIVIENHVSARYLRLAFPADVANPGISIIEWTVD